MHTVGVSRFLYCKLPTIGKATTSFPTWGPGFELQTSEVAQAIEA